MSTSKHVHHTSSGVELMLIASAGSGCSGTCSLLSTAFVGLSSFSRTVAKRSAASLVSLLSLHSGDGGLEQHIGRISCVCSIPLWGHAFGSECSKRSKVWLSWFSSLYDSVCAMLKSGGLCKTKLPDDEDELPLEDE